MPRLLNLQGIIGVVASLALLSMLLLQKIETRHWRKQSGQFEQMYRGEQGASARTVANYRAAAEAARAADLASANRVRTEQNAINERIANDFEIRLAAARAHAMRLRIDAGSAATDPCARRSSAVLSLSPTPCGLAQGAGQDRLPVPGFGTDSALIATEQAAQLDELIRWVEAQAKVDPNRPGGRAD